MSSKKNIARFLVLALFCFANQAKAHYFLPENNLWIGVNEPGAMGAGITEQQFTQILNEIENFYRPVAARAGARLQFTNNWSDGTVNAYADRQGGTWQVMMFGGLARHFAVTADALAVVGCHEVGHHLAGSPVYRGQWASVEGQSDYFATSKCLRQVWKGKNNKVSNEDPKARAVCALAWAGVEDQDLCVRAVMGGKSAAELGRALSGGGGPAPAVDTPDTRAVSTVFESHPAYQCRMDTYMRGALCNVSEDQVTTACTQAISNRPGCWFPGGSIVNPLPNPGPNPNPTPRPPPQPTPAPTPFPTPAPQPPPDPGGNVATQPRLNGQTQLRTRNPDAPIYIQYDVSRFPNAASAFVEISKANQPFSNPNGITRDPNGLSGTTIRGRTGRLQILPRRQLPGWGRYYIRVIPVDSTGRSAVGRFSDSSELILGP